MSDPQRLDDTEQLEILTLLEAASTERSAMRAARALAELMRHLHGLANASRRNCPTMTATAHQPADNPTEQQVRPHDQAAWISAIPPDRKWMRFARLIQRPGRVLGGLAVRAAFGGNQSLTWLPRRVVPVAQGGR